ncbi:MAG TPA: acyl carrier protein [Tissierellia bacterium]|nr:acyl carrier protein [Tissierellia bacterium]
MSEQILNSLRTYFGLREDELTAETSFRRDLAWDDIDLFEVFFGIEQQYDVEIPDEAADQIDTINQLVDWLQASR